MWAGCAACGVLGPQLRVLDLSHNRLSSMATILPPNPVDDGTTSAAENGAYDAHGGMGGGAGLLPFPRLERLLLSYNRISRLNGLEMWCRDMSTASADGSTGDAYMDSRDRDRDRGRDRDRDRGRDR